MQSSIGMGCFATADKGLKSRIVSICLNNVKTTISMTLRLVTCLLTALLLCMWRCEMNPGPPNGDSDR